MTTLTPAQLTMPDVADAHLPGVRAIVDLLTATVETHNQYADAATTRRDLGDEAMAQSAVQTCRELRERVAALEQAARMVGATETRMLAHLDRAVDRATTDRAEGNISRIAEPGHLRCLRENREATVQALRNVRTSVIGVRP